MIDAKVDHLWDQGLVFDARVFAGLKHWFMRGLPDLVKDDGDDEEELTGLEAARGIFRWRGDKAEEAETQQTGAGLLFWSALSDNLDAVRALGHGMGGSKKLYGGTLRVDRPDLFTIFQRGGTCTQSTTKSKLRLYTSASSNLKLPLLSSQVRRSTWRVGLVAGRWWPHCWRWVPIPWRGRMFHTSSTL